MQKTISKSKLKARMLAIFREIESSGEPLIVTDHNRPVLKVIPIGPKSDVSDLFGDIQGQIVFLEDINAPTIEEWDGGGFGL
jgi:antitoxin (DNA-binding transcriptional repressor) of toxin-antitoxin stability system